jgi:hypothetical protein
VSDVGNPIFAGSKTLPYFSDEIGKSIRAVTGRQDGSWVDNPGAVCLNSIHLPVIGIRIAAGKCMQRIAEGLQCFIKDVRAADCPPGTNLLIELHGGKASRYEGIAAENRNVFQPALIDVNADGSGGAIASGAAAETRTTLVDDPSSSWTSSIRKSCVARAMCAFGRAKAACSDVQRVSRGPQSIEA